MWELDCEEGWVLKNWCVWTVVLEKTLENPLDWKEIQPVHSEGDQPWDFFGRNDAKAETPVLWPPHVTSRLIGKDSDAGRDWEQEKGTTRDKMPGWHHWLWWTWVWVNSGSWWWTGRTGVLQFMGSQRDGHEWVTELNWTELKFYREACIPMFGKIFHVLMWLFSCVVFLCVNQSLWNSQIGVDIFLEFSCFLEDPTGVDNLISWSSAF